jgi:hypothetical protein
MRHGKKAARLSCARTSDWHTAPPAVRRLFLANIADGSLAPAGFYAYVVGQNCLFCGVS